MTKRKRRGASLVPPATSACALALLATPPAAVAQMTTCVSVSSSGTQGDNESRHPFISAGGRFVTFQSYASNLVLGDTNGYGDIFVHDRQMGTTMRVSIVSFSGTQANSFSQDPTISADGRFVAFLSVASNLVLGDTNGASDIFVRDRQAGTTTRASVSSSGAQGNSGVGDASISADGRFVAFEGVASNLVTGDINGFSDIFVHDLQAGTTTLVSVSTSVAQGNSESTSPSISADGRFVAFSSSASNLVPGDTNDRLDIFVHDLQIGTTSLVSMDSLGTQGNRASFDPSISADGRFVAFQSYASNLVLGDTNGVPDVFVHDRQTGTTTLVSVDSSGAQGNGDSSSPSISADGRFVAFQTAFHSGTPDGTSGMFFNVFVHDRQTGTTTRVSVVSFSGTQANGSSEHPSISADGRLVAFQSIASNLVPGDTNGAEDIFVHDLPCPGDANGDRVVDFLDLNIVLSDFGQSGPPGTIPGDLDGDGVVDFLDLNFVLSEFGTSC